jgi:hypothetical protein
MPARSERPSIVRSVVCGDSVRFGALAGPKRRFRAGPKGRPVRERWLGRVLQHAPSLLSGANLIFGGTNPIPGKSRIVSAGPPEPRRTLCTECTERTQFAACASQRKIWRNEPNSRQIPDRLRGPPEPGRTLCPEYTERTQFAACAPVGDRFGGTNPIPGKSRIVSADPPEPQRTLCTEYTERTQLAACAPASERFGGKNPISRGGLEVAPRFYCTGYSPGVRLKTSTAGMGSRQTFQRKYT